MPGVVVTTETRGGPSTPLRPASHQFFVVGQTERGDTAKPNLVRSMNDVERVLGDRVTYGSVHDQLETFFSEGGRQAWVARVVGGAATKGTLTLNDRAGVPAPTLRVDAASAGAWSTRLTVEVRDGTVTDTFRIMVRLDSQIVEDQNNITNPAAAVTRFDDSPYIRLTDLISATVAPNNNPAVLADTALSAGSDDRAAITAATHTGALDQFTPDYGDGAVAIPGQTGDTVWNAIDTHCKANNRIGLLAAARGATKTDMIGYAKGLNSEYLGMFSPWVVIPDGAGGTRVISPEGYVAGCRARAHDEIGPWRAPAGAIAKGQWILDVDQTFTEADGNDMDIGKVSVIRRIANIVRLYGWRSLSNDQDNYAYLKDRDLLNRLVNEAEARLEEFVFEPIDNRGQLLSAIEAELVGMVDPIREAGGLYENFAPVTATDDVDEDAEGELIDPGYIVITDSSVNPPSSLAQNKITARLLVRISPTGGLIELTIVKVGILSGF